MRYPNPAFSGPYPTDPTLAMIGDGIGRAIFGDPAARQAQEQHRAELAYQNARAVQARSQAGYDDARSAAVRKQMEAADTLASLMASLKPAGPAPDLSVGGSLADEIAALSPGVAAEEAGQIFQPPPPPPSMDQQIQLLTPRLIAALGGMQGDKVDTTETIGTLASMLGGDEMARRGLIVQGQTPGKEFALTADRADAIAKQGTDAAYRQAIDVATINNRDDIPVAQINANASVTGAKIRADGTVAAAGVRGTGLDRGSRNNNPGNLKDGAFARSQPGYVGNDGDGFAVFDTAANGAAAQERLLSRNYISQGFNTPAKVVARYAPAGENSAASMSNYSAYVAKRLGIGVNDVIPPNSVSLLAQAMREFETGKRPSGTTATGRAPTAGSGKPPKAIPQFAAKQLDERVSALADAVFSTTTEASRKKVLSGWRARAGRYYQRYGDVGQAMDQLEKDMRLALTKTKPKAKAKAGGGWGKATVVSR